MLSSTIFVIHVFSKYCLNLKVDITVIIKLTPFIACPTYNGVCIENCVAIHPDIHVVAHVIL